MNRLYWKVLPAISLMVTVLVALYCKTKTMGQLSNSLERHNYSESPMDSAFVEALVQADEFYLLSLDPLVEVQRAMFTPFRGPKKLVIRSPFADVGGNNFKVELQFKYETPFNDYKVLGALAIEEPAARRQLLEILKTGTGAANADVDYLCFIPRHGLRVEVGDFNVDFLICFQCGTLICFNSKSGFGGYYRMSATADVFNGMLDSMGIYRDMPEEP